MRIATKFEVVRELGRGAFGVVYEARDVYLDRAVAIKTIRDDAFSSEASRGSFEKRFLREARSVARLQHPHIIAVHEAGRDAAQSYMAMELVRGGSLRDVLQGQPRLSWPQLWPWAQALLSALDYAHSQGIVHRDIKPENLMIREDGVLKVADFGIAKALTSESVNLTSDGAILGTPSYMAPEQVAGQPVDGRADLFSACALLYECLAGVKPFVADSFPALVHQIVSVEPAPLSRHASVPAGVEAAIMRGLAKDPARRFASCGELLAALGGETTVRAARTQPSLPAPTRGRSEATVHDTVASGSPGRSSAWIFGVLALAGILGTGVVAVAVAAYFLMGQPTRSSAPLPSPRPSAGAPTAPPSPASSPTAAPASRVAPAVSPSPALPAPRTAPAIAPSSSPTPAPPAPSQPDTTAADRAALDDLGKRFGRDVASGSWDGLSAYFTMDAVMINGDGVFEGRTLIDAYYRAGHAALVAAAPGQKFGWSYEWLAFESDGTRVVARTRNSFSVGGKVVDTTVFDNEYKKVGGRWLIHRAIARSASTAAGGDAGSEGEDEDDDEEEGSSRHGKKRSSGGWEG